MNKTDFEILQSDQAAYKSLVAAIVENRRLAWEIVSAWLQKNNYLLIEDNTARPVESRGSDENL